MEKELLLYYVVKLYYGNARNDGDATNDNWGEMNVLSTLLYNLQIAVEACWDEV